MKTSVNDFSNKDCKIYHPVLSFMALHTLTNGDPCTTGCVFFNHGKCLGYIRLNATNTKVNANPITNAEIARKLNITKRMVSTMRKKGTLPAEYK